MTNADNERPQTSSLTEFLLARIDEDEAVARAAIRPEPETRKLWDGREVTEVDEGVWEAGPPDSYDECRIEGTFMTIYDEGGHTGEQARHIARHDPARVLAECEAKRKIIAGLSAAAAVGPMDEWNRADDSLLATIHVLAAVYANHPDFRDEWHA